MVRGSYIYVRTIHSCRTSSEQNRIGTVTVPHGTATVPPGTVAVPAGTVTVPHGTVTPILGRILSLQPFTAKKSPIVTVLARSLRL